MALTVRNSVWDPFNSVVRQLDRDFDSLVRRAFRNAQVSEIAFVPATDVVRDGPDVVIKVELPGVDVANDVDVEVSEGRLTISGQRVSDRGDPQGEQDTGAVERSPVLIREIREIRTGSFRREFTLPKGVSAEQVEADYDRGVLRVRVRDVVRPALGPRKVEIRAAGDVSGDVAGGVDGAPSVPSVPSTLSAQAAGEGIAVANEAAEGGAIDEAVAQHAVTVSEDPAETTVEEGGGR